jgi:hypothetical protein
VDICIETSWKELDKPICKLAELLANSRLAFTRVFEVQSC